MYVYSRPTWCVCCVCLYTEPDIGQVKMMTCSNEMHQFWVRDKWHGKIRHMLDPNFRNQVLDITSQFLIHFTLPSLLLLLLLQLQLLLLHCVSKNAPTLKRYSSKLHGSILMTFGRNIPNTQWLNYS